MKLARNLGSKAAWRSRGLAASRRQGVVLVFFALFFLGFFGLLAVIIDLGIVRTTQLQMQTSADVAALEGLAGLDAVPGDPMAADLARRQRAAAFAALVFDEDLNPATGPDQFLLGAGPVLSTGVGGVADPAGGLLVAGAPWIPALQSNAVANQPYGDLVAGSFLPLDPADPGRAGWHAEAGDYSRLDFNAAGGGDAFLARLRRTRSNAPLDRVDGVSSAGPTLPYLFGLGSAALSTPDPDVYDPRRDGITVRAAAVADARPATMAGFARPDLPGLAPLARDVATGGLLWLSLDEAGWLALPVGAALVLDASASGPVTGTIAGAAVIGDPRLGALVEEGPGSQVATAPVELEGLVYATLHTPGPANTLRVRGFVALLIENAQVLPGPSIQITATKLGRTVAPRNASAQPTLAFDTALGLPPAVAALGLVTPVLAR